jgi:hydrogenase nickel incorporation protein HypA/HybF
MHEWALAEAVIASALETARKQALKSITEVTIRVGELQQIDHDILEFALSQLRTAKFKKTKFLIETERAQFQCRSCGYSWDFTKEGLKPDTAEAIHFLPEIAHTYIKCPKCGSPDFEVVHGRGVWLQRIRGVK